MAAKICNIELGDRVSKVCISEQKGKRYQISTSFLFATPESAVQDGQIIDIASLAKTIRESLTAHHIFGVKNVNFSLTSTRVVSREVMLPPLKESRIQAAVIANAGDYFPVDISGYSVASCVLEQLTTGTGGWRVQVVAAPKTLLESYNALADALGMRLDNVDYCGNSQYQVLRSIATEDVVLYVDVNDSNTFVSFISKGVLLLQRNIAAGGGELVGELQEQVGGKSSYMDVLSRAADEAYVNGTMSKDEVKACLSRVVGGIARSEDYFNSTHPDSRISKVVLMGVCSSIAGLREDISEAMGGVEVVYLQEIDGIRFMGNSVNGISAYINCIGVLVAPMELFTDDLRGQKVHKKEKKKSESLVASVLIFLLCLAGGLALAGMATMEYYDALEVESKLEKQRQELAYVKGIYQTYQSYEQTKLNMETLRACSNTPTAHLREFLEEMEEKMPVGMLLLSASGNNTGITLNITVPGMEEADVVLSQLRSFESIRQMEVSTITETKDNTGFSIASFSVMCTFTQPNAAENAE